MRSLEPKVSYKDLVAKHGIRGAEDILLKNCEEIEAMVEELQAEAEELQAEAKELQAEKVELIRRIEKLEESKRRADELET